MVATPKYLWYGCYENENVYVLFGTELFIQTPFLTICTSQLEYMYIITIMCMFTFNAGLVHFIREDQ